MNVQDAEKMKDLREKTSLACIIENVINVKLILKQLTPSTDQRLYTAKLAIIKKFIKSIFSLHV